MMNADEATETPRRFFSAWQSALITVLLLLIVGYVMIFVISKAPLQPVVVRVDNLNEAQSHSLKESLGGLTKVQFLSADLSHIHETVSKLSWVEQAWVGRDWYRGVVVSVTPRQAIANFGSQQMLDANGVVFVPANPKSLKNNLVTLHGDPQNAQEMMIQMQRINVWFAPFGLTVKDLAMTPRRTWIIKFNTGLRLVVDHENTEQKLYSFSKILAQHYKKQLPHIKAVDLRYKNGFAIAWKR